MEFGSLQRQSSFGFGVSDVPDTWKRLEYIFSNVPKAGTSKSSNDGGRDDNKEHGGGDFLVMGLNITKWNASSQYMFTTFGVMFFLMMYGLLQEHLVMKTFHRTLGWFVTLLQLSGYAFCAWLQSVLVGVRLERRIPYRQYFILAALQVVMQGFTNLSMHYLNYPAKMLFKSSRVLVTMLVGAIFRRQTYQRKDYIVGFSMAIGLTLFVMADANVSPVFDIKVFRLFLFFPFACSVFKREVSRIRCMLRLIRECSTFNFAYVFFFLSVVGSDHYLYCFSG